MRKTGYLEVIGTSRGRGRSYNTCIETVRNDLKALNQTNKIATGQTKWKSKIHITYRS